MFLNMAIAGINTLLTPEAFPGTATSFGGSNDFGDSAVFAAERLSYCGKGAG